MSDIIDRMNVIIADHLEHAAQGIEVGVSPIIAVTMVIEDIGALDRFVVTHRRTHPRMTDAFTVLRKTLESAVACVVVAPQAVAVELLLVAARSFRDGTDPHDDPMTPYIDAMMDIEKESRS
jgi:hypothetical protein